MLQHKIMLVVIFALFMNFMHYLQFSPSLALCYVRCMAVQGECILYNSSNVINTRPKVLNEFIENTKCIEKIPNKTYSSLNGVHNVATISIS